MTLEYLDEVAEKVHHWEERIRRGHGSEKELISAMATLSLELVRTIRDQEERICQLERQSGRSK